MPEPGSAALRAVFGRFATGVTVVTVGGPVPHGMTANAFTAVSLDPPLALVCVARESVMYERVTRRGAFAVNVLSSTQQHLARHFADRCRPLGDAQFTGIGWRPGPATACPLLDGVLSVLELRLWRAYDGGDHAIFVGRVLGAQSGDPAGALMFLDGRFGESAATPLGVKERV